MVHNGQISWMFFPGHMDMMHSSIQPSSSEVQWAAAVLCPQTRSRSSRIWLRKMTSFERKKIKIKTSTAGKITIKLSAKHKSGRPLRTSVRSATRHASIWDEREEKKIANHTMVARCTELSNSTRKKEHNTHLVTGRASKYVMTWFEFLGNEAEHNKGRHNGDEVFKNKGIFIFKITKTTTIISPRR